MHIYVNKIIDAEITKILLQKNIVENVYLLTFFILFQSIYGRAPEIFRRCSGMWETIFLKFAPLPTLDRNTFYKNINFYNKFFLVYLLTGNKELIKLHEKIIL